jgi:NADPH-dependent F420 reductase
VLGATGPAGSGLSARLASLGHHVLSGSRDPDRAAAAVNDLRGRWGDRMATLEGVGNDVAARAADLVVVATTWQAAVATAAEHAEALSGRVVISMANGLEKIPRGFRPHLPPEGSIAAAMQAAAPGARVVAAFQHVPAAAFAAIGTGLESDVVVCADDDDARERVVALVDAMPVLRAFDGGGLANAAGLEAFAAPLLTANIRHRGKGTLRLLGLESRSV